jgi:hypothetical protein
MRTSTIVICGAIALGVSACGSSGHTALSVAAPPGRVDVSALISTGHVAVSPARIGAGPVTLTVTNQAARAEELVIMAGRSARSVARTAPVGPQGTAQVVVDLRRGRYAVAVASGRSRTDAQRSHQGSLTQTTLRVGPRRASSGSALLTP